MNGLNRQPTGPIISTDIEPTPKHCKYGGQVSVHLKLAGKEVMRYECNDLLEAQEYIDHMEIIGPRLNDRKVWEIVAFTDSGFQTLYLDDSREPQMVMSRIKVDRQEQAASNVHEKAIHARDLASRYHEWWVRRGWYECDEGTPKFISRLAGMVEILNAILREQDINKLDPILAKFCPNYEVEKFVEEFSNRKPDQEDFEG